MKKIFLSAFALLLTCAAFAGKGFRPIHFTAYFTEQNAGMNAPFGSPPISGPYNRVAGDIIINNDDSTFRITSEGAQPGVYRITGIAEESDDKSRGVSEQELRIKDGAGKAYRVSIQRSSGLRSLKVLVIPAGGAYGDPYVVYSCDYMKKLH